MCLLTQWNFNQLHVCNLQSCIIYIYTAWGLVHCMLNDTQSDVKLGLRREIVLFLFIVSFF